MRPLLRAAILAGNQQHTRETDWWQYVRTRAGCIATRLLDIPLGSEAQGSACRSPWAQGREESDDPLVSEPWREDPRRNIGINLEASDLTLGFSVQCKQYVGRRVRFDWLAIL